jgi:quercetin dioxygenase-like cupin family protein
MALPLRAQAPAAVPAAEEPHHHMALNNSYVRVLRVSIPAGDATLLHAHNVPYVYVSLGPGDFANAVAGKPEARVKTTDGQVAYSRGGFAHLVRADAGILCDKIIPGDAGTCDLTGDAANAAVATRPLFETDEIRVYAVTVRRGSDLADKPHPQPGLLVATSGAAIKVTHVAGAAAQTLHAGEMLWLPLGAEPKFTVEDGSEARLMLIAFKDGEVLTTH